LIEQPRHSIEVATTNAERYMQSYTGNRRFWPIKVLAMIDLRKLRAARQQLWGEAAHYQRQGESLALDEALWPVAGVGQEQRRVEDPWEALIEGMSPMRVEGLTGGVNYYINSAVIHEVSDELRVTTAAIFEHVIKIPSGQQQRHHSTRLSEIMRLHGWRSDVFKLNNASVRGYTKISKKVP
jgi:predicted P-loop ATPase